MVQWAEFRVTWPSRTEGGETRAADFKDLEGGLDEAVFGLTARGDGANAVSILDERDELASTVNLDLDVHPADRKAALIFAFVVDDLGSRFTHRLLPLATL